MTDADVARVVITEDAERAIRAHATGTFAGVPRNADGTFTIELDWQVVEFLSTQHLSGETLSDTIVRLCNTVNWTH